jgi:hypothetical protein
LQGLAVFLSEALFFHCPDEVNPALAHPAEEHYLPGTLFSFFPFLFFGSMGELPEPEFTHRFS